jgi:hypothetical protein
MAHFSEERYQRMSQQDEIVPLQKESGTRIYILARPYISIPDYRLAISLHPQPTEQGAIGEVTNSNWVGMRQQAVGQAQAWHYPQDDTLVLWECFLEDWCRKEDPTTDDTLRTVWLGFERFLADHTSGVERIITPSWEPLYASDEQAWPMFLEAVGYKRTGPKAFSKPLHSG